MTSKANELNEDLPSQLRKPRFNFIKLEKQGKKPVESWKDERNQEPYNSAQVEAWTNAGHNIGLVVEHRLFVLDFDSTEAYEALEPYLPDTFTVESQSRDGYHAYYECYDDLTRQRSIETPLGDIDTRIPGKGYIIVPPSKVENTYRVHEDRDIATLDVEDLDHALDVAFDEDASHGLTADAVESQPHSEKHGEPVPDDDISKVLEHIEERPSYHKWLRVIAATLDACHGDKDRAEQYLKQWSPEDETGEYRRKLNSLDTDIQNPTTWATAVHYAQEDGGYDPEPETIEYEKDGFKHVVTPRMDEPLYTYTCPECGEQFKTKKRGRQPSKCQDCGWEDGLELHEVKLPTSHEAIEKSKQTDLLNQIYDELSKHHKMDDRQKLAAFIVACSSALPDDSDHQSAALKGDSSAGKDNLIKTVLKYIPDERHWFVTRATQAAIEDEIHKVDIMAFSEINKHREGGANNEIVEVFKQGTEGGISSMKKDARTGFQSTRRSESEQKTFFYGTTETQNDKELETRYVVIPIRGSREKNIAVVESLNENAKNPFKRLESKKTTNWVQDMIRSLNPNIDVIIPYSDATSKPVEVDGDDKRMFDLNKERIKRDHERLLSLTRTITWLHQRQRQVIDVEKDGETHEFAVSEPCDFLAALQIFGEFFQLTYSGIDHRLQKALDRMRELQGEHQEDILEKISSDAQSTLNETAGVDVKNWLIFSKLQDDEQLPNSRTTLYKRIYGEKDNPEGSLSDLGLVETKKVNKSTGGKISLVKPVSKSVSNRCSTVFTNIPFSTVQPVLNSEMNTAINNELEPLEIEFKDRDVVLPESVKHRDKNPCKKSADEQSDAEQSERPENVQGHTAETSVLDELDDPVSHQDELAEAIENHFVDEHDGAPIQDVIDDTSVSDSRLSDMLEEGVLWEPSSGYIDTRNTTGGKT